MSAVRHAPESAADYFRRLNTLAREHGEGAPRLFIDLTRLDANIDLTVNAVRGRALRIVVKSLPSARLLAHVAQRARTRRFMSFHWPFLVQAARAFPDGDFLLGKPMPLAALAAFFARTLPAAFDPARQIAWLIDSEARLAQYLEFARTRGLRLRIAIEIDVGMHRGGLSDPAALAALLTMIGNHPQHLLFAGFMGYDAHAAKAPWPHRPDGAVRRSNEIYQSFLAYARERHSALLRDDLLINGSGSPTLTLHDADSPLNDLAIGSALVKPTNFEVPSLNAFAPAAWIGAPVLKRLSGVKLPFLERMPSLSDRDTLFLYGGRWMADPAWPPDLRSNTMYGLSSNQQFMSVPRSDESQPDDYVFLRPTQSEAVLLEFGDLVAFDDDDLIQRWPTFEREVRHE